MLGFDKRRENVTSRVELAQIKEDFPMSWKRTTQDQPRTYPGQTLTIRVQSSQLLWVLPKRQGQKSGG